MPMTFEPRRYFGGNAISRRSLVLGCAIAAVAGCGRSDWGTVSGTVTVNGEPVGPGTLIFEPAEVDRRNDPTSLGYFDATGHYELLSVGKTKGAQVGEYRVLIMEGSPASLVAENPEKRKSTGKIPSKYKDYGAQLSATIKQGSQVIDFKLDDE